MKKVLSVICAMLACATFVIAIGFVGGFEVGNITFIRMVIRISICGGFIGLMLKLIDFLDC